MPLDWNVLYTRSNFEKKINYNLIKAGHESFLPLVKELKQWSDRKKWIEAPLFPSYVFVREKPEKKNAYQHILKFNGAVRFIQFENRLAKVKNEYIDFINKTIKDGLKIDAVAKNFNGEMAIEEGIFNGLKGKCFIRNNHQYMMVTMDEMNYNLVVRLN